MSGNTLHTSNSTEAPRSPLHLRRALLGRGLVAAGALALGPRIVQALADGGVVDAGRLVHVRSGLAAPPIVSRSDWGADESIRRGVPSFAPLTKAIVHHTATLTDEPDPQARMRAIFRYHVQGNGWDDIGYNFVIDAEGRIYEGRRARGYDAGEVHDGEDGTGLGAVAAHAYGFNRGSVGVALLGTYTSSGVTATDAALAALTDLLAWKLGTRGIDPHGASGYTKADGSTVAFANVCGHGDVLETGCPGEGLQRRLDEVRDAIAARIAGSGPAVAVGSPANDSGDDGDEDDEDDDDERRRRKNRKRDS